MVKEILQLESTNANDFKNEIVKDITLALKGYATNLQNPDNETLLTREETAKLLSVSLVTLWDWTKKILFLPIALEIKFAIKKSEVFKSLNQKNQFGQL